VRPVYAWRRVDRVGDGKVVPGLVEQKPALCFVFLAPGGFGQLDRAEPVGVGAAIDDRDRHGVRV
jgi:hypothetical protein